VKEEKKPEEKPHTHGPQCAHGHGHGHEHGHGHAHPHTHSNAAKEEKVEEEEEEAVEEEKQEPDDQLWEADKGTQSSGVRESASLELCYSFELTFCVSDLLGTEA
jgi:hypothetical protein